MLFTIIRKELLESIFSFRFPLFLLVGIVLLPMGMYVNELNYSKRLSDYNEQVRLQNKTLSSSQMWDVLSGTVPLKGFRQPAPLSAFASGLDNAMPTFYEFKQTGYVQGEVPSGERSVLTEMGQLDFTFIVQMVISLVVLMFGADVISGEKELGTLRGMLSNSVPRDTVLLGKIIGGYAAIWVPFTVSFLVGLVVLSFTSFPFGDGEVWTRIILIFISSSLFILVYFSIGVMISTSTSRTRTSLVAILVVWAFFQLIVPKASGMMAKLIYPIRTETVVSMEKSLAANTIDNEKSEILGKKYDELFGAGSSTGHVDNSRDDLWQSYREEVEQKYNDMKSAQLNAIDDEFRRERAVQHTIETDLSLVSPGAVFDRLITDICGTGETDKLKYVEAVDAHQQTLDKQLFSTVKQSSLTITSAATGSSVSVSHPVNLNSLPEFSVSKASLTDIFSRNLNGLIMFAFWLIAPFAIAYVRFLKYDVR